MVDVLSVMMMWRNYGYSSYDFGNEEPNLVMLMGRIY